MPCPKSTEAACHWMPGEIVMVADDQYRYHYRQLPPHGVLLVSAELSLLLHYFLKNRNHFLKNGNHRHLPHAAVSVVGTL